MPKVAPAVGIGPTYAGLEAAVLPLNDAGVKESGLHHHVAVPDWGTLGAVVCRVRPSAYLFLHCPATSPAINRPHGGIVCRGITGVAYVPAYGRDGMGAGIGFEPMAFWL